VFTGRANRTPSPIVPFGRNTVPGSLDLGTISGLTPLMQDNKDRQMFDRMAVPKN